MIESKTLHSENDTVHIVEAVAQMYRDGGVAVAQGVLDTAVRILLGKPPETRHRLREYVRWAFTPLDRGGGGRWPNPSKTKGLLQLLKDGEWDVDVSFRKVQKTDKERGLAG